MTRWNCEILEKIIANNKILYHNSFSIYLKNTIMFLSLNII